MKIFRIAVITLVLVALLAPAAAHAAGVFYCSALISSGGNGTYNSPWACSNDTQLNHIIYDIICAQYGGGVLYRIFSGSYVYYRIDWVSQGQCRIGFSQEYPGYPPSTGPDLPIPLMIGAAVAGGVILLGAGLMLRLRRKES